MRDMHEKEDALVLNVRLNLYFSDTSNKQYKICYICCLFGLVEHQ